MTKDEHWTLKEIDGLPDYEEIADISCLLNVRKDESGQPREFTLKVTSEGEQPLSETLNIPRQTQPTRGFNNGGLGSEPWGWSTIFNALAVTYRRFVFYTDPRFYEIEALAAMSSYFREIVHTYPYVDFYSQDVDTGKTTAMRSLIWSSFYGELMTCPTPAVIYRIVAESHCTLGIDEIDNALSAKKSEVHGLLLSILNSGYMKGIPARRCDPNTQKVISV